MEKQLILVNGKDRTDAITSCKLRNGKHEIVFQNSPQVYSYNTDKVCILKLRRTLEPKTVIFKARGYVIADIDKILDYGSIYRVVRAGRNDLSFRREEVEILRNCLAEPNSRRLFQYFKDTAEAVSLITDNGINILSLQYNRISAIEEGTVLEKYLDIRKQLEPRVRPQTMIYPFGLNQSQKTAVENAFSSQISIIQGPPGTGKTQTILNILANAVYNGKTVAVVSNNNSATSNIAEKLAKEDLSFLTAFLGSLHNKENFLLHQTGTYPNMRAWLLSEEARKKLESEVTLLSKELNAMLNSKNRIAAIDQELLTLKPEQFHFLQYYQQRTQERIDAPSLWKLSSAKLMALWVEYEETAGRKVSIWKKLHMVLHYGRSSVSLFHYPPEEAIPFLQNLYYKIKTLELQSERRELEARLRNYNFDAKMQELRVKSMRLFQASLAHRYPWQQARPQFEIQDFRSRSETFNREYPIILSTTYSIKGTLSTEHIYDYLIIDEASQADIATGVLAFSCARNVVIVGDQQQLPNVLTTEEIQTAEEQWYRYPKLDGRYRFSTHSLLSSAAAVWKDVPSTFLREHYRCHPKIAGFFNQKFYHGNLIVMTRDNAEPDVLTLYRTAEGNHARGRVNQRQIDVIQKEVLPHLVQQGYEDIGIITPYRDQVSAIQKQLGAACEIATVHKFQGREKDAIILTSVDNVIGDFVDDPHMLNVAVSRAVKSLSVVISDDSQNEKTNYGDLARYITYHNCQIIDSQVYSVFDLLYRQRYEQRVAYFKKHKRISKFDSENLAFSVIDSILKMPEYSDLDCAKYSSMATLVKNMSLLTEQEAQYAANPLTHLDFLLFRKLDKSPVLAIEIDGVRYHKEGSVQANRDALKNNILKKIQIPLLRIRTNESGERERILSILEQYL